MSFKGKLLKGGAVLGTTQLVGQLCSLGRNVIIARLVSPADFGISAIFVMVIAFLEMMSNLSLDRLLVRAADGNEPKFQQVAHFLQVFRGVVIFIILLVLAAPLASLFSIPEATGAFYVLAFIPLFNGFCHLDPKRVEREMRFWPGASVELISQVVVLILAWPVGKWFGDYRAMLALLLVKTLILMVGTQIVAERKYGWSRDKEYIKRFMTFGWPLLVNGLLLFGILQGDRFIMGSAKKLFGSSYDMVDVGLYSAAFMLTMMPAMVFNKISRSLFLPVLSAVQYENTDFLVKSRRFGEILVVAASIFGGGLLLVGDRLLPLVYGAQYRTAGILTGCLSVLWAIRMLRVLPSTIAMAKGNTKVLMKANFVRILSLAGVLFVVANGLDLVWIAVAGMVGEMAAYCWSLMLIKHNLCIPYTLYLRSTSLFIVSIIVAAVLRFFIIDIQIESGWLVICGSVLLYLLVLGCLFKSTITSFFGVVFSKKI